MFYNGIKSYRQTNVITADPGKLIIMCYEGAIKNLKLAKVKLAARDVEGKTRALGKTREIINELQCSLDFDKGGSIARNLEALYNYIQRRILHSDIENDMLAIDECTAIMSELLEAWDEIINKRNTLYPSEPGSYAQPAAPSMGGYIRV